MNVAQDPGNHYAKDGDSVEASQADDAKANNYQRSRPYRNICRMLARTEVPPIRAKESTTTALAALVPLALELLLVPEGLVPSPPGLTWEPAHVYLPRMTWFF